MRSDSPALAQGASRLIGAAGALVRGLVDTLMPPLCPGCGGATARAGLLCPTCWSALPRLGPPRCRQCSLPLPGAAPGPSLCLGCMAQPRPWETGRAPFAYRDPARRLVLRFKYGREELAGLIAREMAAELDDWPEAEGALVVPVPLHRGRLWKRGYNQSLLLARALARARGLALEVDALVRVRATRSSQGLSAAARARNVAGAFAVRPSARARLRGARILLVDDVLTTGATAAACARTLRRAGAASVQLLVATRVVPTDVADRLHPDSGAPDA